MTHERTIFSLPEVLPFESPSSWFTRSALGQGISLRQLLGAVGLEGCRDLDWALVDEATFGRVASLCGLGGDTFYVARRVMGRLEFLGRTRPRLLLSAPNGTPRYRICPVCMRKDRTPHAYIHWRFSCWRYCPDHMCLMVDCCWVCNAPIQLPATMFRAEGRARAYLSQCLSCGKSHARGPVLHLGDELQGISIIQRMLLKNGRAVLASLYAGYVQVTDAKVAPLSRISKLERMGLLGTDCMVLNDELRTSIEQRELMHGVSGAADAQTPSCPVSSSGAAP